MEHNPEPRVELCLHTTMSDDASLITPKSLLEAAANCGIKAVAITDKNSVQSFHEAACWRNWHRNDMKVIYGAELLLEPGEYATVLVKDQAGLKPLYKLISGKTITARERERLLIGVHDLALLSKLSNAKDVTEFRQLAENYDYIELVPPSYDPGFAEMNRKLYALAQQQDKPLVAVGDCQYLFPYHKIGKDVLNYRKDKIITEEKRHLCSTREMLERHAYLGEAAAYTVVVRNPGMVADQIQQVDPQKVDVPPFVIRDAEPEVRRICRERLQALYGQQTQVQQRLEDELAQVKDTAFSMYFLCHKLVRHLQEKGCVTGVRGTVGSTLIAYLLGISDVNPLPAHHRCPGCQHTEFADGISGFDLAKKTCPECGAAMIGDGHNIPFETCLGVDRDMDLDIDVNTTTAMQTEAKRFLSDWLGQERLAMAGVIGTYRRPGAMADVQACANFMGQEIPADEQAWIAEMLTEVKCCDGLHPGGIMLLPEGTEWEDVTPLRPSDDEICPVATHMPCYDIEAYVPKLDVLAVEHCGQLQELCAVTGVAPEQIDYQDPAVYALFQRADTCGIPEFSSRFTKELLHKVNAASFSDLVKVGAMAHGTSVWRGNGENLIKEHPLSALIGDRDDVFLTLRKYGVDRKIAYALMTATRKGMLPSEEKHSGVWERAQRYMEWLENSDVPRWYIDSMCRVFYLIPKAHAIHYTKLAVAFAWFKIYYPEVFYQVTLQNEKIKPLLTLSNAELQERLAESDRREWAEAQLLLEARQRGYANRDMCAV